MGKHIQFAFGGAAVGMVIGATVLIGRASFPTTLAPRAAQLEGRTDNSPTPVAASGEKITSATMLKNRNPTPDGGIPGVELPGSRASDELDALLREALKADGPDFPDLWRRWVAVSDTPHGFKKASVGSAIAGRWILADREGAMAFIDSLPAGESSDQLRHAFANAWFKDEPARAIEWVARWPSSPNKEEILRRFAPTWAVVDREAAYEFALPLLVA
jgi:hypothetical protein